ncbi:MAG TPA: polysaccharide biosynthesis tyrosine autokinase, partial [Flavisolibacter sp.]|nr:polysaccharide biosynthesis tyrosine autokinase [Flavisolibacter sp.]
EKGCGGGNEKLDVLMENDTKKNIQNEIEYQQSRQMMSRVVKALDLNFTYLAKGKIKELNIYKSGPFRIEALDIFDSGGFVLKLNFENDHNFRVNGSKQPFTFGQVFKNEYGVFRLLQNGTVPTTVGDEYKLIWQPTASVASGLVGNMTVAPKAGTGILILRMEATNAQLAADVINQLMIEYQKATIDDKNAETQNRLIFIDRELDTVARQIDSISTVRLNFIKSHRAFDPQAQSSNLLSRIDDANKERAMQQTLLRKAYQVESDIISRKSSAPVPSSLGLDDPTLNRLVEAYNTAQLERKVLLENAPKGNVAIRQKDEIIDQLQKNIIKNLSSVKESYNAVIAQLQSNVGGAEAELGLMPELIRKLTEISRQLDGKLEIYKSLLVKREETAISLASTISDIKVLQDAIANGTPVKPNRRNIQMLAALIGLVIPALFIFFLEILNDKVSTRYDVERLTSAPIIGEVGHSYNDEALVVTSNNRGVVAEQFRIVRSNLQYVLSTLQRPVILVTSSFSGEGKSFVSTNTGAVMALAGKKTIILEFDIRKPKILSQLHMVRKPGLTNYLLGKAQMEDLPIKVQGYENLYVLACGPVPPNPSELLLDQRLNDLFVYLRTEFDVVIIDTAPVGMVSDAMTLSKFADCTLYIVRQGHTFKKQIGLIDEFHRDGKLPKISVIINDVKIRTGYGYYGYGRYGYGHGYSSTYYEEELAPPNKLQKLLGWFDTKKWKKKRKRTSV